MVVFFIAAVLIVAALMLIVMTRAQSSTHRLNTERYRSRWLELEQKLNRTDESSFQLVILHADKLLDQALKEKGVSGQTMADRMKQIRWQNPDQVWQAHKLRNRIAHEPDVSVSFGHARKSLASFKSALREIGAI